MAPSLDARSFRGAAKRRTRNPAVGSEFASGFRVRPCGSPRNDALPDGRKLTLPGAALLGLQSRDPGLQRLVFLARELRHLLHGLELVAADHVEVGQDALGLAAEQRVELSAHALG